jgi:hypothetical protein
LSAEQELAPIRGVGFEQSIQSGAFSSVTEQGEQLLRIE